MWPMVDLECVELYMTRPLPDDWVHITPESTVPPKGGGFEQISTTVVAGRFASPAILGAVAIAGSDARVRMGVAGVDQTFETASFWMSPNRIRPLIVRPGDTLDLFVRAPLGEGVASKLYLRVTVLGWRLTDAMLRRIATLPREALEGVIRMLPERASSS